MTNRLQTILTITAIVSFIFAFYLDITSFGQDTNILWNYIEMTRILLILSIIISVGLLLGLFFFRKRAYKKRILFTIPIAFLLFSCADILKTATSYYGLDEEYNYFTAKRDIKNGKVQILETGLILPEPNVDWEKKQDAEKRAENQFGYKSVYLGCTVTHGIDIYNSVMEDYLEKVNGKDWRTKERSTVDSIMKHNNP
ncbi:MAG: hypothetical protein ACTHMD_06120 [Flavisolibacter sp.]